MVTTKICSRGNIAHVFFSRRRVREMLLREDRGGSHRGFAG
jgi:hypothetical protein